MRKSLVQYRNEIVKVNRRIAYLEKDITDLQCGVIAGNANTLNKRCKSEIAELHRERAKLQELTNELAIAQSKEFY